jgi:hypothetical protein
MSWNDQNYGEKFERSAGRDTRNRSVGRWRVSHRFATYLLPHPTLRQNRAGGMNAVIYEIDPRRFHGANSSGVRVETVSMRLGFN